MTREIEQRVITALATAFGEDGARTDPQVRPAQNPQFGDYQANCAMGLAKRLGAQPRQVAEQIVARLDVADLCEPAQIAGPGFINLRLKPSALAQWLEAVPPHPARPGEASSQHGDQAAMDAGLDRMGLEPAPHPITVVVDMSSPNLAKEMHVGHLRSTILGDCIARILEFEGHRVHRVNHVGDWGTQFGMLVAYLRKTRPDVLEELKEQATRQQGNKATRQQGDSGLRTQDSGLRTPLRLADLESFYVDAKAEFDRNAEFADQARKTVTRLQGGDPATLRIWKAFCDESLHHCHEIYDRLDVRVEDRGESFYNPMLPGVVEELLSRGIATVSEGAVCIFLEGFTSREGQPLPMLIRKSDGGYNYAATDLAALKYRLEQLGARRLIYVVGATQKQHLAMLFAAARKAGWITDDVLTEHIAFGSVLGADARPFKTREGGTVKLQDLIGEAVARALRVVEESKSEARGKRQEAKDKNSEPGTDLSTQDSGLRTQDFLIAETVGLAAIKYFDLSHNLNSDYRFSFDHMLSMEGNTAPYMLYAYARIRSIGRKSQELEATRQRGNEATRHEDHGPTQDSGLRTQDSSRIVLEHDSEIALAKTLVRFADVIATVAAELRPNLLTDYLFELSKAFSLFYDRVHGVRVIDAPEPYRLSRLKLCDLTARTLKLGLGLLGIKTLERM